MKSKTVLTILAVGVALVLIAGGAALRQRGDDASPPAPTAPPESAPLDAVHQGSPVDDFVALGLQYADTGDLQAALDAFTVAAAAATGAEAALPNYYLGIITLQTGDIEAATNYLETATAADSSMVPAWNALGNAYLSGGRPVSAIDAFSTALALAPDVPVTLTNRGQAYMHISAFDLALADFDRALELDPELTAAYFNRGAYYLRTGDPEAAIDDFTAVLDLDSTQAAAHFNRAAAYAELGDTEAAIDDLNIFLAFHPDETLRAQAQTLLDELTGATAEE